MRSLPSDPPTPLRLFVYGTLRTDGAHHGRFCAAARLAEPATVWGRIRHLPAGYPMLIVPAANVLAHGTADPAADAARQARADRSLRTEAADRREAAGGWTRVAGEILTFDDPARSLPPIDEFEGFRPGRPSLYRRVLLAASPGHGSRPTAAWAYVGEPPSRHESP